MSGQYRSALNYSQENLDLARTGLTRLYTSLADVPAVDYREEYGTSFVERFKTAMDDDFNTPEAYSVLFDLAREINRLKASDIDEAAKLASVLRKLGYVMGILQQNPEAYLKAGKTEQDDAEVARIEALIEERKNAKKNKDWAKADAVRNELQNMGIIIEDGPNGTTWRRK